MRHMATGGELRGKSEGIHANEDGEDVRSTSDYVSNHTAEKNELESELGAFVGDMNHHLNEPDRAVGP
eukprot:5143331-Alexandrium_andersonii.AAC.1